MENNRRRSRKSVRDPTELQMDSVVTPRDQKFVFDTEIEVFPISEDDDIVYLYTVNPQKDVVELIDITNDKNGSMNYHEDRSFVPSFVCSPNSSLTPPSQANRIIGSGSAKQKNPKKIITTKNIVQRKRKRASYHPRCSVCKKDYELIDKENGGLHSAKCGHLYCLSCIQRLKLISCVACDKPVSNFLKIFV